jgi:hypothetical protein
MDERMVDTMELCVAGGYSLALGDHLALRVTGELGTVFFIGWRYQATAGVAVRF